MQEVAVTLQEILTVKKEVCLMGRIQIGNGSASNPVIYHRPISR